MGDVEERGGGAGVFVLGDDAGVEEGHFPAGVFDHFGAGADVEVVEGGVFEFGHGDLVVTAGFHGGDYTRKA